MNCQIVAGASNNQLKDEQKHGDLLKEKGILYAPDFLINAGGLMNVGAELDGYNLDRVQSQVESIYEATIGVFEEAESNQISTHNAALNIAQKRIDSIAKVNALRYSPLFGK